MLADWERERERERDVNKTLKTIFSENLKHLSRSNILVLGHEQVQIQMLAGCFEILHIKNYNIVVVDKETEKFCRYIPLFRIFTPFLS